MWETRVVKPSTPFANDECAVGLAAPFAKLMAELVPQLVGVLSTWHGTVTCVKAAIQVVVEDDKVGTTPDPLRVPRRVPRIADVNRKVWASDGSNLVQHRLVPSHELIVVCRLIEKLETHDRRVAGKRRGEEAEGDRRLRQIGPFGPKVDLAGGQTRMGCACQ